MKATISNFINAAENIQLYRNANKILTREELSEAVETLEFVHAFTNCLGSEYQLFARDIFAQGSIMQTALDALVE